ncbi:hypothetical protein GCM10027579_29810 [Calidifontibacter terrae]
MPEKWEVAQKGVVLLREIASCHTGRAEKWEEGECLCLHGAQSASEPGLRADFRRLRRDR